MKICFVTFEYPPFILGGAGGYAENLVNELSKLRHDVYVIAPMIGDGDTDATENVNVTRVQIIDIPALKFLSFQVRLKKAVSDLQKKIGGFDIFHANGISDFIIDNSKCPRVTTVHHAIKDIQHRSSIKLGFRGFIGEENPLLTHMEKKTLHRADKIISVSESTKRYLIDCYDFSENNIFAILNGIHGDQYRSSPNEINEVRSMFDIDNDEKLILCSPGRIDDSRKGIKYLLQALPDVFSNVNSKCIITGAGGKNIFKTYTKNIPENKLHFVGFLDDIIKKRLFTACDLFVLPSLLEGCPLAILEAMAAGVPIVSTHTGGIPELIKTGRNGLLVETRNPDQLTKALISILCDEIKSKEIGINNYNDARELFNWEKTAKKTEEVYKAALTI